MPCDEELEHCSPIAPAVKESVSFQEASSFKDKDFICVIMAHENCTTLSSQAETHEEQYAGVHLRGVWRGTCPPPIANSGSPQI